MPNTGRRPRLAQKAKLRRFFSEISLVDDFQRHGAVQIDVERLVSDPHRAATQLDWFAVFARHQLVVLKSFRWLLQRRLNCFLERRLAGLSATSKTLAKHADWTEFHRSRKLVTATRTDALGLRFHGSDRRSEASKASQRAWISSSARSGAICFRLANTRSRHRRFGRLFSVHSCRGREPVPVEMSGCRGGTRALLLENPTFREMNRVCVRCSEKVALRFSKTILDSFFSFLPPRYEYREFDARRESFNADWICPGVDPGPESGTAAGRAQQRRMQAHLYR